MKNNIIYIVRKVGISTVLGLLSFNFNADAALNARRMFELAQDPNANINPIEYINEYTLMNLLQIMNNHNETSLAVAAANNQVAFVRLVLEKTNPGRLIGLGMFQQALGYAIYGRNRAIVDLMVDRIVEDPSLLYRVLGSPITNDGKPIFHALVETGWLELLAVIFDAFVEYPNLVFRLLNMRDGDGRNSFDVANENVRELFEARRTAQPAQRTRAEFFSNATN
ncbi:MAG: hypothetical protein LBD60_03305 [Puniceicoccales bacterium]|jgi:hypothetical protein|nr:hypothetical protein [Puniceicoccales bacterium]